MGRCCVLIAALWAAAAGVQEKATPKIPFRMGLSAKTLTDVNSRDAQVDIKVFAEVTLRRRNPNIEVESTVYDDLSSLKEAALAKQLDVVILVSHEYLQIADEVSLDPAFVAIRDGSFVSWNPPESRFWAVALPSWNGCG